MKNFAKRSWMKTKLLSVLVLVPVCSVLQAQQVYALDDCIRIALEKNRDIKIARLTVESANVGKRGALSNILPTVSYSAGYLNQGSYISPQVAWRIPKSEFHSAGISLNQNIYDGGKWWNEIGAAENAYRYGIESEFQTRVAVVLNVKRAFYQYLKDLELLDVAKQSVVLAKRQAELVKHQYEVEAVARTDVLKQEVQVGNMEVEYLNQQAAVKNSYNQLANVVGIGLDEEFTVVDSPELAPSVEPLDILKKKAMNNNPSLVVQQTQIRGSKLKLRIAHASYFPTLSLSVSYDGSQSEFDKLYSAKNWRLQGRLFLSYPLFTGFSQSTQVEKAKIDYKVAKEEYENLARNLEVDLDFVVQRLNNLREMIPIFETTKEAAEEDLRLVQERYNLGAATILDVLDAELSVSRASSSLVQAIYDEKILFAELDAFLGKY